MNHLFVGLVVLASVAWSGVNARAEDWPMYGRDGTRNAVSPEKNPPTDWQVELQDAAGKVTAQARNIKWKSQLGSHTVGAPTVSGGLVWICSNNEGHRDPDSTNDAGCLLCFNEADGKFRWQYLTPRIGESIRDYPGSSVGSPPLVEGDRLWFLDNRWEVVCLNIAPLLKGTGMPKEVWKLDLQRDLGVHGTTQPMGWNLRCTIGASYQGLIYVITGNGVDAHRIVPAPQAPALICIRKETGEVVWKDASPRDRIMDSQCASPLVATVNGRAQVIAPLGDGWVRSFDPMTGKLLWKFDTNPEGANTLRGQCEPVAPPVLYENRLYVVMGTSNQGSGPGMIWCIDPTRDGDVSDQVDDHAPSPDSPRAGSPPPRRSKPNPNSAVIWKFDKTPPTPGATGPREAGLGRALNSVAVAEGLVIVADYVGYIHCFDARTGTRYWVHYTDSSIFGSPLICDGKAYIATQDGDVIITALSRRLDLIAKHEFDQSIFCSPVFANGVLYVATRDTLYAIHGNDKIVRPSVDGPEARGPEPSVAIATGPTTQTTAMQRPPGERRARDAIFIPTPHDVVDRMLKLAGVRQSDVVYDLGCGDGRIVVAAAKEYGCHAAGFDTDRECVRMSGENVRKENVGGLVSIFEKDVFTVDLVQASVITLYMGREVNTRLVPQSGSRIVSHNFDIEGYTPDKVIDMVSAEDDTKHTLYLWTAPLKKKE